MRYVNKTASVAALGIAIVWFWSVGAQAKPAACFTTDDGHYPCTFRGLDKAGSFTTSSPGRPTITIEVERPGVAWAFANFGARNVALPGPYYRARDDGACWENPDTSDRICAW